MCVSNIRFCSVVPCETCKIKKQNGYTVVAKYVFCKAIVGMQQNADILVSGDCYVVYLLWLYYRLR